MGLEHIVVALAGNPNTGKSTVFNSLTGLKQHTGNWPGKTVTNAQGTFKHKDKKFLMVDLPGTYSLLANSAEEEVARNFICGSKPQATVVVLDATCLERNLILALQVLEMTDRVVVCVNLLDEAERKKIRINLEKLSQLLNVPVIGTNARDGVGLQELKDAIYMVANGITLNERIDQALLRLSQNDFAERMIKRAEDISSQVVYTASERPHDLDRKLDNILTSKTFGIPIMVALLGVIFWITIEGANILSTFLASGLTQIEVWLSLLLLNWGAPPWLHGIFVLGIYRTLAWVVSVMLPPMAIFFPLFTLLEDLGYLPRVAFNLDNYFKKARAHGKQVLTMCMGFGCNAAGIISCRIIDSPRERLVAAITNNFVPCNGRFPTLIALSSIFIAYGAGHYQGIIAALCVLAAIFIGVILTLAVSRLLSVTILHGLPSSFTLELPPYRKPQIGRIIIRSIFDRTLFVLRRALCAAAPAGAVIWILANTAWEGRSMLFHCAYFLDPFAQLLGLDGFILMAFILGLPANEIVIPLLIMSYTSQGALLELDSLQAMRQLFIDNGWTWLTAVCTMLFVLNHWPCATTLLTIRHETRSLKWAVISFLVPTLTGIIVCFTVAQAARFLGLA